MFLTPAWDIQELYCYPLISTKLYNRLLLEDLLTCSGMAQGRCYTLAVLEFRDGWRQCYKSERKMSSSIFIVAFIKSISQTNESLVCPLKWAAASLSVSLYVFNHHTLILVILTSLLYLFSHWRTRPNIPFYESIMSIECHPQCPMIFLYFCDPFPLHLYPHSKRLLIQRQVLPLISPFYTSSRAATPAHTELKHATHL